MFIILPSPIPELQHAPLPPKCCEPGIVPRFLALPLFFTFKFVKEFGSASSFSLLKIVGGFLGLRVKDGRGWRGERWQRNFHLLDRKP